MSERGWQFLMFPANRISFLTLCLILVGPTQLGPSTAMSNL